MNFIKITRILLAVSHILIVSISSTAKDFETNKWQVLDMPFKYSKNVSNPMNVLFGASLNHESGKTMSVLGFYNDDMTWILRFCPKLEGTWSYQTFSSIPGLSGKEGTIQVGSIQKADEHGPMVISPDDPQKFAYADGTPYFLMAFELDWLFALDAENGEDIPRTKQIIKDVAEHKFNHIVMNVYAYDASWGERDKIDPKYNFAEPGVFPFGGTNENPDYSTLNYEFFKRFDRVIAHLDQEEIISHLMIYVWNKKVNWPEPNSKADDMYFDYVVKRYQAYPNLVWDISKEALAYGRDDMSYITDRIDRLRKLDAHGRLLSVHDYSYCAAFPDKVDFISIQEWKPNIYNAMLNVKQRHSNKPVFNIEHGAYEKTMHSIFDGAFNDPYTCLDRNYKCIFGGAYSTYYWQNTSWYEVVYEPFKLPQENQPNFDHYMHIVDLFSKYDFTKLKTYQVAFTPMTLTDHKSIYMYYVTEHMLAVTGTAPELKDKTVKVSWFDTYTGQFHDAGQKTFDNGIWIGLNKPESVTSPNAVAILEIVD